MDLSTLLVHLLAKELVVRTKLTLRIHGTPFQLSRTYQIKENVDAFQGNKGGLRVTEYGAHIFVWFRL